jgi:hypothetical protein
LVEGASDPTERGLIWQSRPASHGRYKNIETPPAHAHPRHPFPSHLVHQSSLTVNLSRLRHFVASIYPSITPIQLLHPPCLPRKPLVPPRRLRMRRTRSPLPPPPMEATKVCLPGNNAIASTRKLSYLDRVSMLTICPRHDQGGHPQRESIHFATSSTPSRDCPA